MKPTGHPDLVGEARYQAGAVATAVVDDGALLWEVRRAHDGRVRHTARLAHISHWSESPRPALPPDVRALLKTFDPALKAAAVPVGTLLYPDCSNNQWVTEADLIDFLEQLVPQGFSGMCHKVSEGNYYSDPFWPTCQQWCQENNLPCIGFHYVTADDPNEQAAEFAGNGGGNTVMTDWEANGGDVANLTAVVNAFNARAIAVQLGYDPQWYLDEVGGGSLAGLATAVVSSAYPGGSGYASTIYANSGGDNGTGWAPYGGVTPTCWQFTDQALIGGILVDCNAFKGTQTQLAQLFSGGPVTQPPNADAAPLSNAQMQDLYNWSMWTFAFLFGALTNNPANVIPLLGSPTPTASTWPLNEPSLAQAIANLIEGNNS